MKVYENWKNNTGNDIHTILHGIMVFPDAGKPLRSVRVRGGADFDIRGSI